MKTYIFRYDKANNNRNGNPMNRITVYRVKKNSLEVVGEPRQLVGYRGTEQAVCDIILDNEKGWGKRYNSKNGSENPVADAVSNTIYHKPGKQARLIRV